MVTDEGKCLFIKSDQKTSHAANSKQFVNISSRALQNMYRKINAKASGLRENMLIYLSFLEAHSYPCIFSHQVEVIVHLESISKLTVIRVYFRTKWRLLFIYQLS